MSDTLQPFVYLEESTPSWIAGLEAIRKKIDAKHDEISRVPVVTGPVVKKTGSTESIKPRDNDENEPPLAGVAFVPPGENIAPYGPFRQQAQLTKRKRKTASVLSAHFSGPLKYRSRSMIIVYYDSEVQKAFEELVRNIGTGRNFLRKGKMAAKMEALAQLASYGQSDGTGHADDGPGVGKVELKSGFVMPNIRAMRTRMSGDSDSFEQADKALEKAQNLCERGAHQFLRDGDCRLELDKCRECFRQALEVAQKEVARRTEKGQRTAAPEVSGEGMEQSAVDRKTMPAVPTPMSTITATATATTMAATMSPPAVPFTKLKPLLPSDRMDIEVDDDEADGEIEIDISSFRPAVRLTSRC